MKFENISFKEKQTAIDCLEELKMICKMTDFWQDSNKLYVVSYLAIGKEAKEKAVRIAEKYVIKEIMED